jgi:hypothetical protein
VPEVHDAIKPRDLAIILVEVEVTELSVPRCHVIMQHTGILEPSTRSIRDSSQSANSVTIKYAAVQNQAAKARRMLTHEPHETSLGHGPLAFKCKATQLRSA